MSVRVVLVDDSAFFRHRLKEMLERDPRIKVVGEAINGAEAVEMAVRLRPDVITMDIEMPVMDGISATRQIMEKSPCPILMFSSLTTDGARATLDAMEAGAVDYLPKRFEEISENREEAIQALNERILALAHPLPAVDKGADERGSPSAIAHEKFKLLAIGASAGGPLALQDILAGLPASFPLPIVIVQHMPASFTPAFAARLDKLCAITVREAADGDTLQPGIAYLAPGGKQLLLQGRGGKKQLRVVEAEEGETYRPSVDITFNSIANFYPSQTLALILTGMGADGKEGARSLKRGGSQVWAQDEASSVVYGMPAAVVEAGLSDRVLPLSEITTALLQL
jgi:two-component system chemotaxis response regulator CheB